MIADEPAMADAIVLKRFHGDRVYGLVAEHIEMLDAMGDVEGAARSRLIAEKLELLRAEDLI